MHEICHRCGDALPLTQPDASNGGPRFCAHCGAPQLMLSDYAEPLSTGAEDPGTKGVSTGTLPPPRPNQIDWRLAISSATLVAAVAALLGVAGARIPSLSIFSFVWVVSASLTTMAVYQRRRPLASMNTRIGLKIGALVGVILAFALGASMSVGFVAARFWLHTVASFDAEVAQQMKQLVVQISSQGPVPPELLAFMDTVQFRTVYVLLAFGISLLSVFAMSVFGGAVAGLLRSRRSTLA